MSLVHTEHVLVVPAQLLRELGYFQGFASDVDRYVQTLLRGEHTSYRPRAEMEQDPSFKQLIPYVVFQYTDDAGTVHVFQYTRGSGQGETRLHSKRSVGVGGHISSSDADAEDAYAEGMRRELEEEVAVDSAYVERCAGLINDDLSDVGKVHLGVVHVLDVERPRVTPREKDILDAGFRPVAELLAELEQFETWSQICLKALFQEE